MAPIFFEMVLAMAKVPQEGSKMFRDGVGYGPKIVQDGFKVAQYVSK